MNYADRYDVYGWFYRRGEDTFRKQLEIKLKETKKNQPDLMIIMMNPGSSKQKSDFANSLNSLVPTIHDPTQTHIMYLMARWGKEYARVLNLSDYCDQLSDNFYAYLKDGAASFPEHTIFHPDRENELNKLFAQGTPVILAWGVQTCLKNLANSALSFLADHPNLVGLNHPKRTYSYYHPMRYFGENRFHKISWKEEMSRAYKRL